MRDIQIKDEYELFSIRVTGVVIKDNKVLLNRRKNDDFWTFVGGRLVFGESTEESVLREYKEETGAGVSVGHLSAIVENFFTFEGKKRHEFLYFYKLKDTDNELELFQGARDIIDEPDGEIKWFDLSELDLIKLQPDCSKELINGVHSGKIQHLVQRD